MKPLRIYLRNPADYADAAYAAYADADAAAYTAYADAYATAYAAAYAAAAASAPASYAAAYTYAAAVGVIKDVGIKYAGILVQCQIISSHKELL